MSSWPIKPMLDFLTAHKGHFKPNDPKIAHYKHLDKIDFSGQIHISEKPCLHFWVTRSSERHNKNKNKTKASFTFESKNS